jgi:endogenous inhibitor of DNA gyrase (YacG/DUF329 family)
MSEKSNGAKPPASPAATLRPCPICGKPAAEAFKPFCSRRCGDVDLHRWLGGVYALPAKDEDPDEEE